MSSNTVAKKIRYCFRWIPDKAYIQLNYYARFHKFANLKNPTTFNEKINWLKLHDRNPLYSKLVDKYEVKKIVGEKIGEEYIIPTLGVWDRYSDIRFDELPDKFVLKCTHDSEGVEIIKNKATLDKDSIGKKLERSLDQNFYYIGREWPYKNIIPRIIAEPYIEDLKTGELRDYKFLCFNGEPKVLYVATNRSKRVKFDYYDMDFNHLNIKQKYENSSYHITKPELFDEMIFLSKKLSRDFKHVRVDLYEANKKVYFGELTFYHFSGFTPFNPPRWDYEFGRWLDL